MTKQLRSGGTNSIKIENLDQLKPGEGVRIDGKTKYEYGADLETKGVPLIDPGTGKTISIRVFTFRMNPRTKDFSDKQAIFNSHAKQISTILWGDGLMPYEAVNPKIIVDKEKKIYNIFVPCEAKRGVLFLEKPRNLSEELLKSNKGTTRPATKS